MGAALNLGDETTTVAELLRTRHPEVQLDTAGDVIAAGFLCSPGAPGSGQVRVSHRALFPSGTNGRTFADNAAEEFVLAAAYAELLREHDWIVRELRGDRPRLLVSRPGGGVA